MSDEKPAPAHVADRIRWGDEEEGRARGRDRNSLVRSRSNESRRSMSISRAVSRGRTDPAVALPIQYRTV